MNVNLFKNLKYVVHHLSTVNQIQIRYTTSFFTRLSASELWKGVTTVSNVGRKRGRGKSLRRRIDLNRGQMIGQGKNQIVLPGLNSKVFDGPSLKKIKKEGENKNYEEKLVSLRGDQGVKSKVKIHPLERGVSGTSLFGRSIGVPEAHKKDLEGFDCKVILQRARPLMVKNVGRVRNVTSLVVAGKKSAGLVGFGKARNRDFRKSAFLARSKALKRLRYIQLDGGSIVHDFTSSFGYTTIVCFKMPPGFGVIADQTIKTICNVVGIEDLYVNIIRNAKNRFNLVNAFILGLTKQKTYQQIADEKKLNLVEFKEENDFLPRIIARPSDGQVRKNSEIDSLEIMDFRQYLFEGRVYDVSNLDRGAPFLDSLNYARFLQIHHKHRARLQVRARLKKKYGKVESFLTLREKELRFKKFGKIPTRSLENEKESASN